MAKYKAIRGLSHNLTHSFMSGMNYFDDNHIYPHVYAMARAQPGRIVTINWIPDTAAGMKEFPTRVQKSIEYYRGHFLPTLLKGHGVERQMVRALRTEVYVAKNYRLYVRAVAIDDRGKEYSQFVWA
jgi:hypothetical protein